MRKKTEIEESRVFNYTSVWYFGSFKIETFSFNLMIEKNSQNLEQEMLKLGKKV